MKRAMIFMAVAIIFATGCKKKEDNAEGDGTIAGHSYVDLGLPSGTLWAACNIGAGTPEAYGYYFAWGETEPQADNAYNWTSYKYANGTSWKDPRLTKYCNNSSDGANGFTDTFTILLPEDDAATANWGRKWSTPTREQWDELLAFTTYRWIEQNGVGGYLFVSGEASLFLPAAGYRGDGSLYYVGSDGGYWSSSLDAHNPSHGWSLDFYSGGYGMNCYYRFIGCTIRPVCSASHK